MSDKETEEAIKNQERIEVLTDWLNQGLNFTEIRSLLSKAWREYRYTHAIRKGPRVRIIHKWTDGQLTYQELKHMQKSIDIPFEELSPLAQRLYLDAIEKIKLETTSTGKKVD